MHSPFHRLLACTARNPSTRQEKIIIQHASPMDASFFESQMRIAS
jgi:hypothetical protein